MEKIEATASPMAANLTNAMAAIFNHSVCT